MRLSCNKQKTLNLIAAIGLFLYAALAIYMLVHGNILYKKAMQVDYKFNINDALDIVTIVACVVCAVLLVKNKTGAVLFGAWGLLLQPIFLTIFSYILIKKYPDATVENIQNRYEKMFVLSIACTLIFAIIMAILVWRFRKSAIVLAFCLSVIFAVYIFCFVDEAASLWNSLDRVISILPKHQELYYVFSVRVCTVIRFVSYLIMVLSALLTGIGLCLCTRKDLAATEISEGNI